MIGSGREMGFGIFVGMENNVSGPARDATKSVNDLGVTMDNVSKKIQKQSVDIDGILKKNAESIDKGNAMMEAGVKVMAAGAAVLAPIFIGIGHASDLEENLNKNRVAFGEFSKIAEDFANNSLANFGVDKIKALDMSSLFGDMSTAMGIGQKQAAGMATELVGLAGDLSSFKNISADMAQSALKGIFTGEGEALKGLGVIMNETTLQAHLMSQGINTKFKDLSQSEKVMQRFSFVMAMSKNAMGDFARTSDGFANSKRVFEGSLKEISATLGAVLMPIMSGFFQLATKITVVLNKFAGTKLGKTIIGITVAVGGLLVAMGLLLVVMGFTTTMTKRLGTNLIEMGAKSIGVAFSQYGLAGGLSAVASSAWAALVPLLPYIAAVAAVVAVGYLMLNMMGKQGNAWEKLKAIISGVTEVFKTWNGTAFELSAETHDALEKNGILPFFLKISTWVVRIKTLFTAYFDSMMAAFSDVGDALSGVGEIFTIIGEMIASFSPEVGEATASLDLFKMVGYAIALPFRIFAFTLKAVVNIIKEVVMWAQRTGWIMTGLKGIFHALMIPINLLIDTWSLLVAGIDKVMNSSIGKFVMDIIAPEKEGQQGTGNSKGVVESQGILSSFAGGADNLRENTLQGREAKGKPAPATIFDKSTTKTESVQVNLMVDSEVIAKKIDVVNQGKSNRRDG